MQKSLHVKEFDKKQDLLDFVNKHNGHIEIVSISSTQMSWEFKHFLWYFEW